jgi:glycosyltransferase involved in cell wall biosynthesis
MEDDVQFVFDDWSLVEKTMTELGEHDPAWDLLYLGLNADPDELKRSGPPVKLTPSLYRVFSGFAGHAYIVRAKSYQNIIQLLLHYRGAGIPYDVIYSRVLLPSIRAYCVNPLMAVQRPSFSTIQNRYTNYDYFFTRWNAAITSTSTMTKSEIHVDEPLSCKEYTAKLKYSFGLTLQDEDDFIENVLRSVYDVAYEIIIVEGAVGEAVFDRESRDKTIERIEAFPDPDSKITFIRGRWKDKIEQLNECMRAASGDYVWQLSSNEIYKVKDLNAIDELLSANKDRIDLVSLSRINSDPSHKIFKREDGCYFSSDLPPTVVYPDSDKVRGHLSAEVMARDFGVFIYHYSDVVHKLAEEKIEYGIALAESNQPVRILHITERLSKGGAGRALIANAKYSQRMGNFQHKVISIAPILDGIDFEDLEVLQAPSLDRICKEIEQADIVQWHWWQPIALMRQKLPKHFALILCHTSGNRSPHQLTQFEIDFADHIVAVCQYSLELPAFSNIPQEKLSVIVAGADFERVLPVLKQPHTGFNSGWIGTIDDNRYPLDFLSVHAAINIPDFKVLMFGMGPVWNLVREQVRQCNIQDRFKLLGYRENMRLVYGRLDIFGFYLNSQTTAAAELNLQEAMVSGLPIVMLPHGGPKYMIEDGVSGVVASTTREYQQAIEHLYAHPEERLRMGNNARKAALESFGAENSSRQLNALYVQIVCNQREKSAPMFS